MTDAPKRVAAILLGFVTLVLLAPCSLADTPQLKVSGNHRFLTYAMVYVPVGRAFSVQMDKVTGPKVKAWWFNPRTGQATQIGEFENKGQRAFQSPDKGENLDWVLVLDDASKGFPPPGTHK